MRIYRYGTPRENKSRVVEEGEYKGIRYTITEVPDDCAQKKTDEEE